MADGWRNRQSTRMRRQYTREQKSQLVDLVATGKATVAEAAKRLGVGDSAAYSWVAESRQPRQSPAVQPVAMPTFVRLVASANIAESGLSVRVGAAEVQVHRGFDDELLRAVVATLAEAAR